LIEASQSVIILAGLMASYLLVLGFSMTSEKFAILVELLLQGGVGLYLVAMGFRWIGKKPGVSERYDEWHAKSGPFFKVVGPTLIVIAVFLASSRMNGANSSSAIAPGDWTIVKTQDGRASVLMPGKSEELSRSMDGEFGKIDVHMWKCTTRGEGFFYFFSCANYPPATFAKVSQDEIYKRSREFALAEFDAELIEEHEKARNGLNGQEYRAKSTSKHSVLYVRNLIQNSRVYSFLIVERAIAKEPAESEKFFNSLKIEDRDQPKNGNR
jgi:hypothetical protein